MADQLEELAKTLRKADKVLKLMALERSERKLGNTAAADAIEAKWMELTDGMPLGRTRRAIKKAEAEAARPLDDYANSPTTERSTKGKGTLPETGHEA